MRKRDNSAKAACVESARQDEGLHDVFEDLGFNFHSFTSTAFQVETKRGASPTATPAYLALSFDNGSHVGTWAPTGTGLVSYTSAGFTPQFAMVICNRQTVWNTEDAANSIAFGIGASNWYYHGTMHFWQEDNVGTSNCDAGGGLGFGDVKSNTGADAGKCTINSWLSNGWEGWFTTSADERNWLVLAIEEEGAPPPTIHGTILGGGLTPQLRS